MPPDFDMRFPIRLAEVLADRLPLFSTNCPCMRIMKTRTHDVGMIGLGYVGLTLATALADVGLKVLGIEKRADVARLIRSGTAHFQEKGLNEILSTVTSAGKLEVREEFAADDCCDIYVITVGTPIGDDGNARLDMIENASRQVAASMPEGALVALRSTVKVGTCRNVVAPILAESGKAFMIAMCPERTIEGNAMTELRRLPQIIGADTADARTRAGALFSRLTSTILPVSSLETAEIMKLADNTYRDLQFAFANEIARLCDAAGVSSHEVISTGKLGYPRTNIARPGLVGGPCLEKDPHILRQSAQAVGIDMEITAAARLVNERQPRECAEFIAGEMARRKAPPDAAISILGLAFKGIPETDDLRGSMSLRVIAEMKRLRPQARLRAFDPVVKAADLERLDLGLEVAANLADAVSGAFTAIITNNHPIFETLGFSGITRGLAAGGFVYDFWSHFNDVELPAQDVPYYALGNVRRAPR